MTEHEGFAEAEKEDLVCRLKKSSYRLKLFLRQCYKHFDTCMLKMGYKGGEYDCSVYS